MGPLMFTSWFSSRRTRVRATSAVRHNHYKPTFERLEDRSMLTVLFADVQDPNADLPGDNLYRQIQEAVDAASIGDVILVREGVYEPVVINTDGLRIQKASSGDAVIDGNLNLGDENGVEVNASGVTIKGLTVQKASGFGSFGNGFLVTGNNNTLTGNWA